MSQRRAKRSSRRSIGLTFTISTSRGCNLAFCWVRVAGALRRAHEDSVYGPCCACSGPLLAHRVVADSSALSVLPTDLQRAQAIDCAQRVIEQRGRTQCCTPDGTAALGPT